MEATSSGYAWRRIGKHASLGVASQGAWEASHPQGIDRPQSSPVQGVPQSLTDGGQRTKRAKIGSGAVKHGQHHDHRHAERQERKTQTAQPIWKVQAGFYPLRVEG